MSEFRRGRVREGVQPDAGVATVFACIGCLAVIALSILGIHLGAAAAARHQAESAADLGALAGAQWALRGAETACDRAAAVVGANRAQLTECRVEGLVVSVQVRVQLAAGVPGDAATGRARAGPSDAITAPG